MGRLKTDLSIFVDETDVIELFRRLRISGVRRRIDRFCWIPTI